MSALLATVDMLLKVFDLVLSASWILAPVVIGARPGTSGLGRRQSESGNISFDALAHVNPFIG